MTGLEKSIVDLAGRAQAKELKPDEIQGGTFSITNFGNVGSVFATPVIQQPQVAIWAWARLRRCRRWWTMRLRFGRSVFWR